MLKLKEVKFMKNIRPFYLERIFAKYEFNAPYLLCSSDCESISIKELLSLSSQYEKNLEDLNNKSNNQLKEIMKDKMMYEILINNYIPNVPPIRSEIPA